MIHLTIRPIGRGRFAALINGTALCVSREPFLDAARALKDLGVPSETPISFSHEGSSVVSMRSTVGTAAGLTVQENDHRGPRFAPYRPHPSEQAFPSTLVEQGRRSEAGSYPDKGQQRTALCVEARNPSDLTASA